MDDELERYPVKYIPARELWTLHRVTYVRRAGTHMWDPIWAELLGSFHTREAAEALRAKFPASPLDSLEQRMDRGAPPGVAPPPGGTVDQSVDNDATYRLYEHDDTCPTVLDPGDGEDCACPVVILPRTRVIPPATTEGEPDA